MPEIVSQDELDSSFNTQDLPEGDAQYTFFGRIQPERVVSNIGRFAAEVEEGWIDCSIQVGQISAVVHTEGEVENELTLRNTVLESVYGITDVASFTHGYAYEISIDVMVRPDGSQRVFGVDIETLTGKLDKEGMEEYALKITSLLTQPDNEYLRMALKNLRLAMADPVDTPMFCYRAIESLRKEREDNGVPEKRSWDALWDYIDFSGEPVRDMGDEYAHDSRHGRRVSISDESRAEIFEVTWTVLQKYIDKKHASSGG